MEDILQARLTDAKYDATKSKELCDELCDEIKNGVKSMSLIFVF